ncbi:GAF domain-containing protein [Ilumatobacter nonamiensis]|uniref:GAF domain-containing protein n=1 Tax=Ilumatobacter nonamiensis TaxID=467093 RepID=UPI0003469B00|nr:GAF domain-containing protein [Ilumatobacter nonamiensis]
MSRPADAGALHALCALARVALGAASVSIATVHDDGLRYVAADGTGADGIRGMLLPPGDGIAGFVAATGQSISVRDPVSDPRFARSVGERTGYIPNAIQCVAVLDDDGDVAAVLSILDRSTVGPADGAVSVTGIVELVVDVAAGLIGGPGASDFEIAGRLADLGPRDRVRATDVVTAVLDAFDS